MQLLDDPVETGKMYTSLSDTVRNVKNVTVDVYDKSDGMKSLKGFTPFPVSFQWPRATRKSVKQKCHGTESIVRVSTRIKISNK